MLRQVDCKYSPSSCEYIQPFSCCMLFYKAQLHVQSSVWIVENNGCSQYKEGLLHCLEDTRLLILQWQQHYDAILEETPPAAHSDETCATSRFLNMNKCLFSTHVTLCYFSPETNSTPVQWQSTKTLFSRWHFTTRQTQH